MKSQNHEFWKFAFLHVGLEADTARCRCRMNVVERALEWAWIKVYDHKIFDNMDGWKFLSGQNFRWVGLENLRNLLFQKLDFCFHEASSGLDLRR